jgi:predicted permease
MPANVEFMTAECGPTLGVTPLIGRWCEPREAPTEGPASAVAVITYRYWQRMFGGTQDVLGRTLQIENGRVTVIGVMPDQFNGLQADLAADIIAPFNSFRQTPNAAYLVGRLRGASVETLRPPLSVVWMQVVGSGASSTPNSQASQLLPDVQPLRAGISVLRRLYAAPLAAVAALAVLLLLLTCVNVGGLLLSRVRERSGELAVMRSLGANRARVLRGVFLECLVLAAAATALGVVWAFVATSAFSALLPWGNVPWTISFAPDGRVLAGVALSCVGVSLLVAAVPGWIATRDSNRGHSERTVARGGTRWGNALVVAQLATTIVILFACGLLVRSFTTLSNVDRGFLYDRILSARLLPGPSGHQKLDQVAYYPALLEKLAALPGVESAGFARYFGTINAQLPAQPVSLTGDGSAQTTAVTEYVSPNFFATVGIPLLYGRDVSWTDLPSTDRVAVLSESLARSLSAEGDVIGRTIEYGPEGKRERLSIVGVVGNVSLGNFRENAPRIIFVPAIQAQQATFPTFHLRTGADPMTLAPSVRHVVDSFGREYVQRVTTIDGMFSNGLVGERMAATVSGVAAFVAIVLAAIGLYALLAHSVVTRAKEIGIRLAVGATPSEVRAMLIRHVGALLLWGVAIGVPAAFASSSVLQSLMFGITPRDVLTMIGSVTIVATVSLIASMVPAHRAAHLDPTRLLRSE